jgi:glycosyltransferase involved in cell wall biosynthesis
MGTIHWELGDFDRALECFEKGFVLSPTAPHVAANYHAAIGKTETFARGLSIFEEVIQRYPRFSAGIHLLIDIFLKMGRTQSAMDLIETLLLQKSIEPALLDAALAVREKLGPIEIKADQKPTLSLCMIVKNEKAHLAQCLASLKPVVDEMIVVDTGSDDQTRSIAAAFGAQVYRFDWFDDFAAARNHSLAQAHGDWILVVDADEIISTQDHRRLRSILNASPSRKVAFSMVTRNYMNRFNTDGWVANDGVYGADEKSSGWVPSQKVRLFPNNSRIRFEFPVHEIVDHSITRAGFRIKQASIPIHHYGKINRKKAQSKGETYFRIGLRKLEANYDQPKALRELAIQAVELDHFEEAITLWRRLLEQEPSNSKAWTNLSALYIKTGQYRESHQAALNAVNSDPDRKEGHLNLGVSELYVGNAERSAEILGNLLRRHPDYPPAIFFCGAAQVCASGVSAGLKTFAGLKRYPTWQYGVYAFSDLAKGLHRAGHPEYAQRLLDVAEDLYPGGKPLLPLKASQAAGQINIDQRHPIYSEAVCN